MTFWKKYSFKITARQCIIAGLSVVVVAAAIIGTALFRNGNDSPSTTTTPPHIVAKNEDASLLSADKKWNLAGVTHTDDGLHVAYVGRNVVHQDGTPGQANPAVNLYGTYLDVTGSFSLSASVDIPAGKGAITLYGQPPIVSDESRADPHSLRIVFQPDTHSVWVGLTNGSQSPSYVAEKTYSLSSSKADVVLTRNHGTITLAVNGKELGSLPESGLFDSGKLWFGLDTETPGNGWSLNKLSIKPLSGGLIQIEDSTTIQAAKNASGLNAIASRTRSDFRIGAAISLGPLVSDSNYSNLALNGNFGIFTPENAMKAQFIHPQPKVYSFEDADALVAIAEKQGVQIHGHALVFGEANPAWMQQIAKDHPDQLKAVMVDHITTIVSRYKGRVRGWDVVNEPLADYDTISGQDGLRQNIWYQAIGPSYIETALKTAHQADPDAQLWINDFGMEMDDDRFNDMLTLITRLKSEGIPLYGIGFQSHIDDGDTTSNDTTINTAKLASRFTALQKAGVKARISELDVSTKQENSIFSQVVKACFIHPNCIDATFWGITDAYSSGAEVNGNTYEPADEGLPWDKNFRPTSAVDQIKQAVSSR